MGSVVSQIPVSEMDENGVIWAKERNEKKEFSVIDQEENVASKGRSVDSEEIKDRSPQGHGGVYSLPDSPNTCLQPPAFEIGDLEVPLVRSTSTSAGKSRRHDAVPSPNNAPRMRRSKHVTEKKYVNAMCRARLHPGKMVEVGKTKAWTIYQIGPARRPARLSGSKMAQWAEKWKSQSENRSQDIHTREDSVALRLQDMQLKREMAVREKEEHRKQVRERKEGLNQEWKQEWGAKCDSKIAAHHERKTALDAQQAEKRCKATEKLMRCRAIDKSSRTVPCMSEMERQLIESERRRADARMRAHELTLTLALQRREALEIRQKLLEGVLGAEFADESLMEGSLGPTSLSGSESSPSCLGERTPVSSETANSLNNSSILMCWTNTDSDHEEGLRRVEDGVVRGPKKGATPVKSRSCGGDMANLLMCWTNPSPDPHATSRRPRDVITIPAQVSASDTDVTTDTCQPIPGYEGIPLEGTYLKLFLPKKETDTNMVLKKHGDGDGNQ